MTLPPIPDEAWSVVRRLDIGMQYPDPDEVLEAAWPHLYAAALAPVLALCDAAQQGRLPLDSWVNVYQLRAAVESPDSCSDADRIVADPAVSP